MADGTQDANVNGEAQTDTDPPTDTQDDPEAVVENLRRQLAGQQRTNERLRSELKDRESVSALREELRLAYAGVDKLYEAVSKSPILDDSVAEDLRAFRDKTTRDRQRIDEESKARAEIVDIAGAAGIDFESDEAEAARAYYESGEFDKAVAALRKIATKKQEDLINERAEELVQERLRETGKKVNTGGSTGSGNKSLSDEVDEAIASGKYDPRALLRRAAEASRTS